MAAYIFQELVRIHPFYNGNGRAIRLFTENFLQNNGYKLKKWPEETLYRKACSLEELANSLKNYSERIL
jgi:prophage maintenance system killer protein